MRENRDDLTARICDFEWEMFAAVHNRGGRASCQNDAGFFKKMRACQFAAWSDELLRSWLDDLLDASRQGRNLLAEKYAWMMESTCPEEFALVRDQLEPVTARMQKYIDDIVAIQVQWQREVDLRYPAMRQTGRPLTRNQDGPGRWRRKQAPA